MDAFQAVVTLIENDGLTAFGSALGTFLSAEAAANADPIKMGLAYAQLQTNLLVAAPQAEGTLIGQLSTALAARLSAKVSAAPASTAAAVAALSGTAS